MFSNIVTDQPVSWNRFHIMREYKTREEAEQNLKADTDAFISSLDRKTYLLLYPLAYATVRIL